MSSPKENGVIPDPSTANDKTNTSLRRSSRSKKAPANYDAEKVIPAHDEPRNVLPTRSSRPKRKAAVVAAEDIVPDDSMQLLEEAIAAMEPDERKEWHGWDELESEPAFFDAMLDMLGVPDLKIQEIFGTETELMGMAPKPVHGIVFLFEYVNGDNSAEQRENCPDGLWFANQTTANACATVALMNIIMNAQKTPFGPELQKFKNQTRDMPPPHRGHMLDNSDFIRAIHNSVARRIDLMSEDLLLDNKNEAYEKAKKSKRVVRKPKGRGIVRKMKNQDTGNHYIAYVPFNGQVWELDGLETKPLCLGRFSDSEPWLEIVRTTMELRMTEIGDLQYNILAVCQNPVVGLRERLLVNIACIKTVDDVFRENSSWTSPSEIFTDNKLSSFKLTMSQIETAAIPSSFTAKLMAAGIDVKQGETLMQELMGDRLMIKEQYKEEMATREAAMSTIRGRQRDYTPIIHAWALKLAEMGVLKDMLAGMS